jgi:type I restriction enzyme, S subunit
VSKPVMIGDLLHRIKRPINLEPASRYKLVTVKLYHKGVVLREEKLGADIKSKMYQVKEGDFILSGIDARNGAFGIVPPELDGAVVTNDFWYFEIEDDVVDKSFFLEITSTHWFDEICRKGSDGTTQRIRLQKDKFFNQTIYLPDLSEQRIFNKTFQAIKASNKTLSSELTRQQTLLKKLRQQILQEAIEGKLTADWRSQNPDVEPASELLKRIAAEKAQLVKDKKIKAQKPLPPITEEEKPFDLPQGWEWCRIWEIAKVITSGSRDWAKYYSKDGAIFVTMGNLSKASYQLRMDTIRYVKPPRNSEGARTMLLENDLLISITGDVGNLGLIPPNFGEAYINQHTCVLRFMPECQNKYFPELMRSPLARYQYDAPQRGIKNSFRLGDVGEMIIPIPPKAEQQAIVTKVEKLLALCDQLETQITRNQTHAEQLMQAVLKEAFSHNSEAEPAAKKSKGNR